MDQIRDGDFPSVSDYGVTRRGETQGAAATDANPAFTFESNKRTVFSLTPKGNPPDGGWPVVMVTAFLRPADDVDKFFEIASLADCKAAGASNQATSDIGNCSASRYRNILFKQLVDAGFAVILPGPWLGTINYYSWFHMPDPENLQKGENCETQTVVAYREQQCRRFWPGPDKAFLGPLIDDIADGNYGPVDMERFSLGGFSAGANFVSRQINNYPSMKTPTGRNFPDIKTAFFLAGGSYMCYVTDEATCPEGKTEEIYDSGERPWSKHPPSILFQATNDDVATTTATSYYHAVLKEHGVGTQLVQYDLPPDFMEAYYGDAKFPTHSWSPQMINPGVAWFEKYRN